MSCEDHVPGPVFDSGLVAHNDAADAASSKEHAQDHQSGAQDQIRQLARMSLAELQAELMMMGVAEDPGMLHEDYVQRLHAFLSWEKLPLPELLKECEVRKISTAGMRQASGAQSAEDLYNLCANESVRHELIERLVADLRLEYLEGLGVPARRICCLETSSELAMELERLEKQKMEDLKGELNRLGLTLPPCMDEEELQDCLRNCTIWHVLPTDELYKECNKRNVSTAGLTQMRGAEKRAVLLERLKVAMLASPYEAQGIPVQRLGCLRAAAAVAEEWYRLERSTLNSLNQECANLQLLLDAALEREEILAKLKEVVVWKELPLAELGNECRNYDVPTTSALRGNHATGERRQELVERLLATVSARVFEAQGVPAKRIGSTKATARVAHEWQRISCTNSSVLKEEYQKLDLPHKKEPSSPEIEQRLRAVALWWELPSAELRLECQGLQISTRSDLPRDSSDEDRRHEMMLRLLTSFLPDLEAAGIPARRLASAQKARAVAERWKLLEEMRPLELESECKKFGLPTSDSTKAQMERMKTISIWQELPISQLGKELESYRVQGSITGNHEAMLKRLIAKAWPTEVPIPDQHAGDNEQRRAPVSKSREKHLRALGLQSAASIDEIRRTYRQLALKYHPDKNPGDLQEEAARRFREVTMAYEALCG